jgi:hypothetical protein
LEWWVEVEAVGGIGGPPVAAGQTGGREEKIRDRGGGERIGWVVVIVVVAVVVVVVVEKGQVWQQHQE